MKNTLQRTILHMDMDAFFASVEQAANPGLRDRAIAIVGAGKRTVVTTASYEARALGIKTGMSRFEATKICPQLTFVIANNRKYTDTSVRIMKILEEFSPLVEPCSVDEAFLDITGTEKCLGSPEQIGRNIKTRIKEGTGLTASIGIGPNKLISKLASDIEKPDGLVIVKEEDVEALLKDLPVNELCGIGKKTTSALSALGIHTCADLGTYPIGQLRAHFGITGEQLSLMGRGIDTRRVMTTGEQEPVKSLGHSTTLPKDVSNMEDLARIILQLSEAVGARARRYNLNGKTITITIRFSDFRTITRRKTISTPTQDSHAISKVALALMDAERLSQPVRLLGVSISSLSNSDPDLAQHGQGDLFQDKESRIKTDKRLAAMDRVNRRYGSATITWGTLFKEYDDSGVISPAWRPSGPRKIDVK